MKTFTTTLRTIDVFNNVDSQEMLELFMVCYKRALKCGLKCSVCTEGHSRKLRMIGPKINFVKYYSITLWKNRTIRDGIKRVIDIIKT